MSIREQVEDAKFLADNGRHLGALTVLMLAVAASARKTFPQGTKSLEKPTDRMGDREAFTLFVGGRIRKLLFGDFGGPQIGSSGVQIHFREQTLDLAYILYKYYRCELIHDAKLPEDVAFTSEGTGVSFDGVSFGTRDNKLTLGIGWIDLLINAVTHARCNGSEFDIVHTDLIPLGDVDDTVMVDALKEKYGTTVGRIAILKEALCLMSPPLLVEDSDAVIGRRFDQLVSAEQLSGGSLTGLRSHALIDNEDKLTERGVALLRDLTGSYQIALSSL